MAKQKPLLTFWQIWNMSFGFLGVQIGYGLQTGNTSRILSALGADVNHLSYFWLAAPLAGLDRTTGCDMSLPVWGGSLTLWPWRSGGENLYQGTDSAGHWTPVQVP